MPFFPRDQFRLDEIQVIADGAPFSGTDQNARSPSLLKLPRPSHPITLGSMHPPAAGRKEREIMDFLHGRVFDPILQSPVASEKLKQGVRYTIMRMEQRDAEGMVQYYWSAIIGTERSIGFAALMRREGFGRFEEALEEFRVRFDNDFLRQP